MPWGIRRNLNLPKGVMNIVRSWLSVLRALMVPFMASITVKYLFLAVAMSAIASAGVEDW